MVFGGQHYICVYGYILIMSCKYQETHHSGIGIVNEEPLKYWYWEKIKIKTGRYPAPVLSFSAATDFTLSYNEK